ncbi:MAG: redoxin domain-containing protein [Chloroflexi bacterium]|nr:redoxin domain-containing protein [Chloroflexota bacterium]
MGNTLPLTSKFRAQTKALPAFSLSDHNRVRRSLDTLMGPEGMLLGFIGDIWRPISINRILTMQKEASKLAARGLSVAIVIRGRVNTLTNFIINTPVPVTLPLLADPDGMVQATYRTHMSPGLLLLDRRRVMRFRWLLTDELLWPMMDDVLKAASSLRKD